MATRRAGLTRERVLDTAIRLADEGGIESLSMRKLARELGVEAMSLYNHVANKGDLVDAIVDLVMDEIELPEGGAWDDAIRRCAVSANEVFLRHAWAAGLVLAPPNRPGIREPRFRYMEWLLRTLREAGFSPRLTYSAYHTLDAHILGFTLWQLGHMAAAKAFAGEGSLADLAAQFISEISPEYPFLVEHVEEHMAAAPGDGEREYEFGLDLILEGLRRALAA